METTMVLSRQKYSLSKNVEVSKVVLNLNLI